MFKISISVANIFFISLIVISYDNIFAQPENSTGWKNYTNNYFNLTMEIPTSWRVVDETSRFNDDKALYFDYEIFDKNRLSYSTFARTQIYPIDGADARSSLEDQKEYVMARNSEDSSSFSRIIEDIQENKYNISSGQSYSFLYVTDSDNLDNAVEVVDFVHNGQGYRLLTMASPANYFDEPQYNEDLKRVINSIDIFSNNTFHDDSSSGPENIHQLISNLTTPIMPNATAIGNENAILYIVEFGNYLDPFSARFNQETKPQLISKYMDTGIARFGFKDLILEEYYNKDLSVLTAEASYCAADQGKYWKYHDEIYSNSKGKDTRSITQNSLVDFARNINMTNISEFTDCLASHKYNQIVVENDVFAKNIGLTNTPTFLILKENSTELTFVEGAQPLEVFDDVIAPLLER